MVNKTAKCGSAPTNGGRDIIPARYVLTLMTFLGMCLVFSHRVCFNVALVAMVNGSAEGNIPLLEIEDQVMSDSHCPLPESEKNNTLIMKEGPYPWTPSTQGVMLGAYFYGYVATQIVGGSLGEVFGAKRMMAAAVFASSVLTCLTPIIAELPYWWMIALRVVLGLIHGLMYPGAYALLSRWSPPCERSTLLSCCVIGTHFGVVVGMPLTGYLCERGRGWPDAFYLQGGVGFVWFVLWLVLVFEIPEEHPRISPSELKYIQISVPQHSSSGKSVSVPWLQVLGSAPVWAVTVAKFCGAWSFICFQSKLPAYLDEVLHLPIHKNGLVNSLLFGTLCVSIVLSGKLSDYILSKEIFRRTTIRKVFETVALLGPACCLTCVPLVRCDADTVVALLTCAMALFGLCGGGDVAIVPDLTPDLAGKIFGVSNAIASIPGILSPVVAGYFLEGNKGDVRQWIFIFYISVGMYLFGAVVFLIFGSAEVQPWGTTPKDRARSTKESNLVLSVPVIFTLGLDDLKKDTVIQITKL